MKPLMLFSLDPLRAYNNEDITIQLPGEMTVFSINWLSVYDLDQKSNYGSVIVPEGLNVPPSLVKVGKICCFFKKNDDNKIS